MHTLTMMKRCYDSSSDEFTLQIIWARYSYNGIFSFFSGGLVFVFMNARVLSKINEDLGFVHDATKVLTTKDVATLL